MDYKDWTRQVSSVVHGFNSTGTCVLGITLLVMWLSFYSKKRKHAGRGRLVPKVGGGLPFFGHALHLGFNTTKFVKKCYKQYGEVFCIKLFWKNFVIVCSQDLAIKYFKTPDSVLSSTKALEEQMHLDWAFCSKGHRISIISEMMRKAVTVSHEPFIPKIEQEVEISISELLQKCKAGGGSHKCHLRDSADKFAARSSFLCFVSMEFDDETYEAIRRLNHTILQLAPLFTCPPAWIMEPLMRFIFGRARQSVVRKFEAQIQKCREESSKSRIESPMIEMALEYVDENNEKLSNLEIAEVLPVFLFASIENTSVCIANAAIFLALPENSHILVQVRAECEDCYGDSEKLLRAPLLNACLFESVRLSSHYVSLIGAPRKYKPLYLGEYFIENNVDAIVVSGQMFMRDKDSCKQYKNPTKFNPYRFLGEQPESYSSNDIITWGSGPQRCPGKRFAIMEVKLFLAHLLTKFDLQIQGNLPPFIYTMASFAERQVPMTLTVRHKSSEKDMN